MMVTDDAGGPNMLFEGGPMHGTIRLGIPTADWVLAVTQYFQGGAYLYKGRTELGLSLYTWHADKDADVVQPT